MKSVDVIRLGSRVASDPKVLCWGHAPVGLSRVSDQEKCHAIATAIELALGIQIRVRTDSVSYGSRMRQNGFKDPATLTLVFLSEPDTAPACRDVLAGTDDDSLARLVASALSEASGEDYVAMMASRRYDPQWHGRSGPDVEVARLSVQITRKTPVVEVVLG